MVWHPHFNLGRRRAADDLIVPLVDQLHSSCSLVLLNLSRMGTQCKRLPNLVMMSSSSSGLVRIHDGIGCCTLHFFNVLSWGRGVPSVEVHHLRTILRRGPVPAHQLWPHLSGRCCLKIFEHLVYARNGSHISPRRDESQRGFLRGADSLVGSLVDLLSHVLPRTPLWLASTKPLTQPALKALWFVCGNNRKFVLVPPSHNRGSTPFSLLFNLLLNGLAVDAKTTLIPNQFHPKSANKTMGWRQKQCSPWPAFRVSTGLRGASPAESRRCST